MMASAAAVAGSRAESPVPDEITEVLRVVEDPEGSVNVRSGPSLKSAVSRKLASGSPVILAEPNDGGEWKKLEGAADEKHPEYIHSSRLVGVGKWKAAQTKAEDDAAVAKVELDGYEVKVESVPFQKEKHRLTKDGDGMALVDGVSPWGVDGGLPTRSMKLTLSIDGKPLALPAAATADLYQPNSGSLMLLTPRNAGELAVVLMMNSDGAGAYCVAWSFSKGRYVGREVFVPY
ncbi:MAG: hypothetical protein JWL81_2216 [Verrucomicrobiales bacterium]|nr:hypothetical protein [Verrucomicrobiales bacterium]